MVSINNVLLVPAVPVRSNRSVVGARSECKRDRELGASSNVSLRYLSNLKRSVDISESCVSVALWGYVAHRSDERALRES